MYSPMNLHTYRLLKFEDSTPLQQLHHKSSTAIPQSVKLFALNTLLKRMHCIYNVCTYLPQKLQQNSSFTFKKQIYQSYSKKICNV